MNERIQFKNICSRYHDSWRTLGMKLSLKHRSCPINPYNNVKLGRLLLDPHLCPCTYPPETTEIPISEQKRKTVQSLKLEQYGKTILIKYQSSPQFTDIPSRARGGCLVHWRFLSTSVNFLYEGISAGLSPERMKLNPYKTLRKDKWRKIKHLQEQLGSSRRNKSVRSEISSLWMKRNSFWYSS